MKKQSKIKAASATLAISLLLSAGTSFAYPMAGQVWTDGNLNVRKSASIYSKVLDKLQEADFVEIVGETGGFYQVQYKDNEYGYCSKAYLGVYSEQGGYAKTDGGRLKIRSNASTTSSVLGFLNNGEEAAVVGQSGDFYKIVSNQTVGYVHKAWFRLSVQDTSSKAQKAIQKAESLLGSTQYNGYCQRFVRICFEAAGIKGSAATAIEAYQKWGVSQSDKNIPVGATVYFETASGMGHVGIYMGNDMVIHAVKTVKKQSLSSMKKSSSYQYLGWGWQGGVGL